MSAERQDNISARERSGALWITIDRPEKKNAMTPAMAIRVGDLVRSAPSRRGIHVVVLEGSGDAFSSGADLDVALPGRQANPLSRHTSSQPLMELLSVVNTSKLPVIAGVSGWALGAGMGLVAASTLVVASRRAVFRLPEADLGIFPTVIVGHLIHRVGVPCAMRWALTCESIDAEAAASTGLVDFLVGDEDALRARLQELVASIAAKPLVVARAGMEWRRAAVSDLDRLTPHAEMLSHLYAAGTDADIS